MYDEPYMWLSSVFQEQNLSYQALGLLYGLYHALYSPVTSNF